MSDEAQVRSQGAGRPTCRADSDLELAHLWASRAKRSVSCGVPVMIETEVDFARALERLRRRDTGSLAAFILSLAQDSGPVGEQVRTFIVGDVVAEAAN